MRIFLFNNLIFSVVTRVLTIHWFQAAQNWFFLEKTQHFRYENRRESRVDFVFELFIHNHTKSWICFQFDFNLIGTSTVFEADFETNELNFTAIILIFYSNSLLNSFHSDYWFKVASRQVHNLLWNKAQIKWYLI